MAMFSIENRAQFDAKRFSELSSIVERHTSIKHALDWLLGMSPPVAPVDAIAQDEYSHDVVFPYPLGCWIVYDCT